MSVAPEAIAGLFELIQRSRKVMVITRAQFNVDGLATALAWQRIIASLGGSAQVGIAEPIPERLRSLAGTSEVVNDIPTSLPLIVDVDLKGAEIGAVRYELRNGRLSIHLTPKSGTLQGAPVSQRPGEPPYDLVIALDAPTRESWGTLFERHRDVWLHLPTVTIDTNPNHSRYGQLNIIDAGASSVAEITWQLMQAKEHRQWLDANVATCLYAGLLGSTNKFSAATVTPQLLGTAGELLRAGARRDEVTNALYKYREVPLLRLWGSALTSLQWDAATNVTWTTVTRAQVETAAADEREMRHLLDELVATSPHADVAVVFYERTPEETVIYLSASRSLDALQLTKAWGGRGDSAAATFTLAQPLPATRDQVIASLNQALAKPAA